MGRAVLPQRAGRDPWERHAVRCEGFSRAPFTMRFEHLLQVTDPADPRVPPMSRAELWRGLLRRVDAPQDFPMGPDRCSARRGAGGESERHRRIHFGSLVFEDHVQLEAERRIVFTPRPHEGAAPVRLTITLEEPAPALLCLRFVYEVQGELSAEDRALQRYREQAWLEMDCEMLRTLREWLAAGTL